MGVLDTFGHLTWMRINSAPICILLATTSGTIVQANPAACRQFGYTALEITHLTVDQLHCGSTEHWQQLMSSARRGQGSVVDYAVPFRRANGTGLIAQLTFTPLRDSGDAVTMLAVMIVPEPAQSSTA